MLMEVLFWFPTVRTVTCWGGALGAAGGKTRQSGSTNQVYFIVLSTKKYTPVERDLSGSNQTRCNRNSSMCMHRCTVAIEAGQLAFCIKTPDVSKYLIQLVRLLPAPVHTMLVLIC